MSQLISVAPLAIIIAIIPTALYALSYAAVKKALPPIGRTALVAAFSVYVLVILSVTLLFRNTTFFNVELDPIASYRRAANAPAHLAAIEIRNIFLNVAMFVPLGIILPRLSDKFRKFAAALPVALLASLAIETAQIATRRGVFSIEDILHNTAGAALGLALYLAASKIFKKP
jgi:glycopeptide antibiotics resistance protein